MFDRQVIKSFVTTKRRQVASFEDIARVCESCGVIWKDEGKIVVSASEMNGLGKSQANSLSVFQNNLLQLIHLHASFQLKLQKIDSKDFVLYQSFWLRQVNSDFEARLRRVFYEMVRNLLAVLQLQDQQDEEKRLNENSIASNSFNEFISGNPEKMLNVVPSRELARKLGLSDQKLRREIYLARQRVLKPPRSSKERISAAVRSEGFFNGMDSSFPIVIPTCASPPSSTIHSSPESSDDEMEELENVNNYNNTIEQVESNCEETLKISEDIDGWTSIDTWLKSDMFEDAN